MKQHSEFGPDLWMLSTHHIDDQFIKDLGMTPAQFANLAKKLARHQGDAEQALDAFNATLGFGKSNCSSGGDCTSALGIAVSAMIAAVYSGGENEEPFIERQIATAGAIIENLAADLAGDTLAAAKRQINGGMKIPKAGGGEFNHVGDVEQTIAGRSKQVKHLERSFREAA